MAPPRQASPRIHWTCAQREEAAAREQRTIPVGPDGGARPWLENGHRRALATILETVQVARCAWRAPGAGNLYPADAALGLPKGRHSFTLAKLAAIEAVRGSFDTATEAIVRRCGQVIGKCAVEQQVMAAAADIDAFYRHRVAVPATAEMLLVLSVDGQGIVMRPEALRPATARAAATHSTRMRTRLASGEKPARKRMATLAAVYDAAPAPRRGHDVIAPTGGRAGERTLRPGPKAQVTWLAGSVRNDPQEVIAAAFSQAADRDPARSRTWTAHPARSSWSRPRPSAAESRSASSSTSSMSWNM